MVSSMPHPVVGRKIVPPAILTGAVPTGEGLPVPVLIFNVPMEAPPVGKEMTTRITLQRLLLGGHSVLRHLSFCILGDTYNT